MNEDDFRKKWNYVEIVIKAVKKMNITAVKLLIKNTDPLLRMQECPRTRLIYGGGGDETRARYSVIQEAQRADNSKLLSIVTERALVELLKLVEDRNMDAIREVIDEQNLIPNFPVIREGVRNRNHDIVDIILQKGQVFECSQVMRDVQ